MLRFSVLLTLLAVVAPEASSQAVWKPLPWVVRCFESVGLAPDECDQDVGGSATHIVASELNSVTAWLRELDFPQMVIERTVDDLSYLAWLGPDSLFLDDEHVLGYYVPSDQELVVNAFHFIQLGGQSDYTGTASHELFHSVQPNYPSYSTRNGRAGWIIEGTAQAFEAAWLSRASGIPPLAPGGHGHAYGPRLYSIPVHLTPEDNQEYATAQFWLALGEMIGSEERIAFVRDVLENAELEPGAMLDAVLAPHHPDGFSYFFPRLLARYASGDAHYTGQLRGEMVADGYDETREKTIAPLSAHSYRFASSEQEPLEVEVEFEDDPSIHLVFDGTPADELSLRPETVYRRTLLPGDTLRFLVVNVAPEAGQTVEAPYRLTVRAEKPETCNQPPGAAFTLNVTGPREGSGAGSFVFDRETVTVRGREMPVYHGLTVIDNGDEKTILWDATVSMKVAQQLSLARQRLNMPDASDEEVGRAFRELKMAELRRLFPELLDEGEGEGVGLPDGFSIRNSTREGDGTHALNFKNGESQFSIMLPLSEHFGTGRVQSPMLNIGVQAPAFLGGGGEGIVLSNPDLTFSALIPGRCVAGTFTGVYESPVGHANPVTGTFRVIVPDDAREVRPR